MKNMKHTNKILYSASLISNHLLNILNYFKIYQYDFDIVSNSILYYIFDFYCYRLNLCSFIIRFFSDKNPSVLDLSQFANYFYQTGFRLSLKCLDHYR